MEATTIENKNESTQSDSAQTLKCVSAVFKQEDDTQKVVQQLIDKDISKDHISLIGRNFQTQTKISGFITKKDLILDGLASGALYGSLFGSLLGLLTGVGVLFIPFVGTVAAAGPLGAALLGIGEGALFGALGAGLGSALISLGMPQDKAAIYQTRIQAGEFLLVAEVAPEMADEIASLLESAGGEEIATTDMTIPKEKEGEMAGHHEISPEMKGDMSEDAQKEYVTHYNESMKGSGDHKGSAQKAWDKVKETFDRDEKGMYASRKS